MKKILALLALAAACTQARAQVSFQTLGRLFTTPDERFQLDQQRLNAGPATAPGNLQGTAQGIAPSAPAGNAMPAAGSAQAAAEPPPPPTRVQLSGVLRRSNGRGTIWIDGVPQDAPVPARAGTGGVPVDVDGRRVMMKPGQSYDPNDGTVGDRP